MSILIAVAAWLSAEMMEHPGWGAFALGVLVVACNRFYFPTQYELTAEGIVARYPLKNVTYRWPEVRRFVYDQTGGFLSPRAKRSFLDEYRGISLLFECERIKPHVPLTLALSRQGRGDKAKDIIRLICQLLPKDAIVREVMKKPALREEGQAPCGG